MKTLTKRYTEVLRKKLGNEIKIDDIIHDLIQETRNAVTPLGIECPEAVEGLRKVLR